MEYSMVSQVLTINKALTCYQTRQPRRAHLVSPPHGIELVNKVIRGTGSMMRPRTPPLTSPTCVYYNINKYYCTVYRFPPFYSVTSTITRSTIHICLQSTTLITPHIIFTFVCAIIPVCQSLIKSQSRCNLCLFPFSLSE